MPREIIKEFIDHITNECTAIDVEERYRDFIRECYDFAAVGGPFAHMDPAAVLEEQDPTAYRCGQNDYVDGEGWIELCGGNYDAKDVDRAAEEFIDDLESELSDLEDERDEIEEKLESAEDDADFAAEVADELRDKEKEIEEKEAEIAACKHYTF